MKSRSFSDEIIAEKTPAYYKRLARDIRAMRNQLESVNRTITCGGVLVRPDDAVVADGVVMLPNERSAEVAQAAMKFFDNISLQRAKVETAVK